MTLSLVSTSSELRGVHASMPEHKAKYAILHQVLNVNIKPPYVFTSAGPPRHSFSLD